MKKHFSFFLLFAIIISFSQNFRVPFREKQLWGFADQNGTIKVTPKYDSVSIDNQNFRWFVFKNDKKGLIDSLGNEILKPEFDSIEANTLHSKDNDFYLFKNGKVGYSDINGKIILPIEYEKIEACTEFHIGKVSIFFAKKTNENFWMLKDQNNVTKIDEIQDFEEYYDGNYSIKKNGKWGFYNVTSKKWAFEIEYDEIGRLRSKDYYEKKSEYAKFEFFAKKDGVYFLIADDYEILEYKKNYEDIFDYNKSSMRIVSAVEGKYQQEIKSVNNDLSSLQKFFEINNYTHDAPYNVKLINDDKKLELIIYNKSTEKEISKKYDEIKLIYNGSGYEKNVGFFRKKDSWGIFDLNKFEWITEISFDEILLSKTPNVLLLKYKNKVGLYEMKNFRADFETHFIPPIYDEFINLANTFSLDDTYKSFHVYYFKKDGKIYPVGMNGVKFYKD